MSANPRFVLMVGDSMEPTVRPGDLVAVLPADRFRGDGIYVIEALGEPNVVRVQVDGYGRLTARYDNPRYSGGAMTQDAFEERLLGCVFAICAITDRAAMEDAGMLDGWEAAARIQVGRAGA